MIKTKKNIFTDILINLTTNKLILPIFIIEITLFVKFVKIKGFIYALISLS